MSTDQSIGGVSLGSVVSAPEGLVPVGWLQPGDLIETLDQGFQPVAEVVRASGCGEAVNFGGGVLAGQRLLTAGWPVELYFGHDEMLAHAGDLRDPRVEQDGFAQIIMHRPAMLRVGDVWVESHDATAPTRPVLSTADIALIRRAFGCPVVRYGSETRTSPGEVSSTFGSQVAVA